MTDSNSIANLLLGIVIGCLFMIGIFWISGNLTNLQISQNTANKICENLTGNSYAVGYDWDSYPADAQNTPIPRGGFVCRIEKPTFDHTNLIQIETKN